MFSPVPNGQIILKSSHIDTKSVGTLPRYFIQCIGSGKTLVVNKATERDPRIQYIEIQRETILYIVRSHEGMTYTSAVIYRNFASTTVKFSRFIHWKAKRVNPCYVYVTPPYCQIAPTSESLSAKKVMPLQIYKIFETHKTKAYFFVKKRETELFSTNFDNEV